MIIQFFMEKFCIPRCVSPCFQTSPYRDSNNRYPTKEDILSSIYICLVWYRHILFSSSHTVQIILLMDISKFFASPLICPKNHEAQLQLVLSVNYLSTIFSRIQTLHKFVPNGVTIIRICIFPSVQKKNAILVQFRAKSF